MALRLIHRLLISIALSCLFAALLERYAQVDAHRHRRTTTTASSNSATANNKTTSEIDNRPQVCSISRQYPVGTIITVECPDGYELYGNSFASCNTHLNWTGGALGSCRKKTVRKGCLAPSTPKNGLIINQLGLLNETAGEIRFEAGGFIRYSCSFCYVLKGFPTITCRADGTWTGEAPSCQLGYYFVNDRIARC